MSSHATDLAVYAKYSIVTIADLQPEAVYIAEGDSLRLNCSVTSSVTCPGAAVKLLNVTVRHWPAGEQLSGQVQLIGGDDDRVVQFTLGAYATLSDAGNVYCSLVAGNTTLDSHPTHVYVLSQLHTHCFFGISAISIHWLQMWSEIAIFCLRK